MERMKAVALVHLFSLGSLSLLSVSWVLCKYTHNPLVSTRPLFADPILFLTWAHDSVVIFYIPMVISGHSKGTPGLSLQFNV